MIITQDTLIKQIADKEDINVATVREILNRQRILFSTTYLLPPSENLIVKILNGISLERKYIPKEIF